MFLFVLAVSSIYDSNIMRGISTFSFVVLAMMSFSVPIVFLRARSGESLPFTQSSLLELASVLPQQTTDTSPSFEIAKKESYGFFDYIPEEDWRFRQRLARTRQDHPRGYSSSACEGRRRSKLFYLNHYYPSFSCPHIVRVGRETGDGPKWLCDPQRIVSVAKQRNDTCLVYSIGSKGRFEFENGLVEFTGTECEIHVIDPGRYGRHLPENMHYHQWGIGSSYDPNYKPFVNGKFLSMQETVKELGHSGRVIDVLKIGESYVPLSEQCYAWFAFFLILIHSSHHFFAHNVQNDIYVRL